MNQAEKEGLHNSKPCCVILEKIAVNWMSLKDGTRVMPYINGENNIQYRVNHCPSCGSYIRNIMLKPKNQ